MIDPIEMKELLRRAEEARGHAYAPYSHYRVGAALLTTQGRYYSGANVENAALSTTIHAEMSAVAAAVSNGETNFRALLVFTEANPPPFPCALCRQTLAEFNRGDLLILAANPLGATRSARLADLYPEMFGPHQLA